MLRIKKYNMLMVNRKEKINNQKIIGKIMIKKLYLKMKIKLQKNQMKDQREGPNNKEVKLKEDKIEDLKIKKEVKLKENKIKDRKNKTEM